MGWLLTSGPVCLELAWYKNMFPMYSYTWTKMAPSILAEPRPKLMPLHRSRSAATSIIAPSRRNNITTKRTMLRLSPLLLLLQLLSTAPAANAELVDGKCSCSPVNSSSNSTSPPPDRRYHHPFPQMMCSGRA